MPHRDITLTPETTDLLNAMGAEQYDNFIDYLNNPVIRQAADKGQELLWWGTTNHLRAWMEIRCDKDANVDMQLWEIPHNNRLLGPEAPKRADPRDTKLASPLYKRPSNVASLEFRRMQGTIRELAYAMRGAGDRKDFALFERMAASLGKHVPWVEQSTTLAHRVHPSAAGPHLYLALQQMSLLAELVDEDVVRSVASPCTTAQALLAVHASSHAATRNEHNAAEPGLYALESFGNAPMYMFVQPHKTDSDGTHKANGAHIWLDHTGTPIFINEVKAAGDARFAWLAKHPDPQMAAVNWMPLPATKHGVPAQLTEWKALMHESFNPQTRALCDRLAQAAPRALYTHEANAVVDGWMNAQASTTSLWEENVSKVPRTQGVFDWGNKSHLSLAMWAQYASKVWSHENPKEYAVLAGLLPAMDSLEHIEHWRHHMKALSAQTPLVASESYSIVGLSNTEHSA